METVFFFSNDETDHSGSIPGVIAETLRAIRACEDQMIAEAVQ